MMTCPEFCFLNSLTNTWVRVCARIRGQCMRVGGVLIVSAEVLTIKPRTFVLNMVSTSDSAISPTASRPKTIPASGEAVECMQCGEGAVSLEHASRLASCTIRQSRRTTQGNKNLGPSA